MLLIGHLYTLLHTWFCKMKQTKQTIFGFALLFILCFSYYYLSQRPKKDDISAAWDYMNSPQFNGSFHTMYGNEPPDTLVKRIRDLIPAQWQPLACERAFYSIKEGASDSIRFRHLDLFEQYFPIESVFAFTQAFRANLFTRCAAYDTAMVCANAAYKSSVKINSGKRISEVKSTIGVIYSRQGEYAKATKALLEAYQIYLDLNDERDMPDVFECMLNIGDSYHNAKDYVSAQEWFQRAWDFSWSHDTKGFRIKSAAAMADNFTRLNQLDSAKQMIDTAFYLQKLYDITHDEANRYYILAQVLLKQGHCADALHNFQEAKSRNLRKSSIVRINHYHKGLGDSYLCLGRLDSATASYQKALIEPDTITQASVYEQLAKVYQKKGDMTQALKYNQESQKLNDRLFTIEKNKEVGRVQAQNELALMIKETKDKQNWTRWWGIVGLLFLSISLIGIRFWYLKQKQKRLLIEQQNQLLAQEKQRQAKTLEQTEKVLKEKEAALQTSVELLDLKETLISELQLKLTDTPSVYVPSTSATMDNEIRHMKILTPTDWVRFRELFEERFPNYMNRLKEQFPEITNAEMRLFLLYKTNFTTNEITEILGISYKSVSMTRYRLRKKLGLLEDEDLEQFIQGF